MLNVLVTGGLGFIGSHLVRALFQNTDAMIWNLDRGTYAADPDNIPAEIEESDRYCLLYGDISDERHVARAFQLAKPRFVFHLAAESHVDNSIVSADPFIQTNVVGTQRMLEAAQAHRVVKFIHVSTDEVYGHLGPEDPRFTEETPLAPRSPYAASKAASDMLARAWFETHRLPVVITRCSNNYGPNQHAEKLIPKTITRALKGEAIPVYGKGDNIRDWIHVQDHCEGILAALYAGKPGEVYNFGGDQERTNLELVRRLVSLCGQKEDLVEFVADRKGHDHRYAIDHAKATRDLGWRPRHVIEDDLPDLVAAYR